MVLTYLHYSMLLFKRKIEALTSSLQIVNLHYSMLLFKPDKNYLNELQNKNLHYSMLLFKLHQNILILKSNVYLHYSMLLFKLKFLKIGDSSFKIFTLQYVAI